jgi:hypothetical protein
MRRYALTHRVLPNIIEESKIHFNLLARDRHNQRNNTYLTIELLNDENHWKNAYTISITGIPRVIVPIKNLRTISIPTKDESPLLILERNILISKDHKGEIHTESVILLPDSPTAFTGNIISDPWLINSLERPQCAILIADAPPLPQKKVVFKAIPVEREATWGINTGDDKIRDIKDYLKCYDNNPSNDHIYELMVCVEQPEPGTRKPWGIGDRGSGNPVDVGHTFLVATEKTPNKTIVRNVGFYPSSMVWPYGPTAPGMLNNDSYHDFNIALVIRTISHQFTQVLSYLLKGNNPGYKYNLNNNNCSTFILDALLEGNILLPRTVGHWKNGAGCNPGDLGEDIRTMSLPPNMKRITSYQSHPNQGSCV